MKKTIFIICLLFANLFYAQEFENGDFESIICPDDCLAQNGQMTCVDYWWDSNPQPNEVLVPLKKNNCEPSLVCSGNYSIQIVSTSGSPGTVIRTENPFYGLNLESPTINLDINRSSNGNSNGGVRIVGNQEGEDSGVVLGFGGPNNSDVCENISIILDASISNYAELSFIACVPTGITCHGSFNNYIVIDNIEVAPPVVIMDPTCNDVTFSIDTSLINGFEEFSIQAEDSSGSDVGDVLFNHDGSPLTFTPTENGTYTFHVNIYVTNGPDLYFVFTHTFTTINQQINIIANDQDITETLTTTILCGETCITLDTVNLYNVVYSTNSIATTDTPGEFCVPSGSDLTSFVVTISGVDVCDEPYTEDVTVFTEIDSQFEIIDVTCNGSTYSVTATTQDQNPNHRWELWESEVENATSVSDGIIIAEHQSSWNFTNRLTTVTFTGLDPNKFYFIIHGVWGDDCPWEATLVPVAFTDCCIDSQFTIDEYSCSGDTFSVTASTQDQNPNHRWELWRTSVEGSTSDEDSVGMVGPQQSSWNFDNILTTVTFDNLNVNRYYYIKHGVWGDNCAWEETRIPISYIPECCDDIQLENDCTDCCETEDDFMIRVVDGNGNLVTDFNSIIWSDGDFENQNIRRGSINIMYSVTVTIDDDCSYSDDLWIRCGDEKPNVKVLIYPNPTRGVINVQVELEKDSPVVLNIYRYDGRLLRTMDGMRTEQGILNMRFQSNLPVGLYFFTFNTDENEITKKVRVE